MKPAATIDEYIAGFPAEVRQVLQTIRETIRAAAPEARERISYKMPTFALDKVLVHFGAFKGHIGLYPPVREPELQDRVRAYSGEKDALRFPLDQPIPYGLIGDIVRARVQAARGILGTLYLIESRLAGRRVSEPEAVATVDISIVSP